MTTIKSANDGAPSNGRATSASQGMGEHCNADGRTVLLASAELPDVADGGAPTLVGSRDAVVCAADARQRISAMALALRPRSMYAYAPDDVIIRFAEHGVAAARL